MDTRYFASGDRGGHPCDAGNFLNPAHTAAHIQSGPASTFITCGGRGQGRVIQPDPSCIMYYKYYILLCIRIVFLYRSKTRPPQTSPRGDEPFYSVAYSPSGSVNPHKVSRARSHGTVARRQSARRCNLLKSARMARPPRARLREQHRPERDLGAAPAATSSASRCSWP